MQQKDDWKQRVDEAIERRASEIAALGEAFLAIPEMGFKEIRTAALVADTFQSLGLSCETGLALTGVIANLPGRSCRMKVAVMGELDAIIVPSHPCADPHTGAAHACGHNASLAAMIGTAMGLNDSGVMALLDGDVSLMAVPAEELVELEYRLKLRREGKLFFLAGKQEFIRLGMLDGVDAVLMFHLMETSPKAKVLIGATHNGVLAKYIRYRGRESHAGGAPHFGINALNAALIGLTAIHAQRETFRDEDCIRVHPIITRGGDLVNVVPADVRIETFIRGRTLEAIGDANLKVNRALRAGAMAIGAGIEIQDLPGYLPSVADGRLDGLFAANMAALLGEGSIAQAGHLTGSTDIGDVSHLMPALHAYIRAGKGNLHTEAFSIVEKRLAYVETAKGLAMTVIDLLWDGAREGRRLRKAYRPKFTKRTYLKAMTKMSPEPRA